MHLLLVDVVVNRRRLSGVLRLLCFFERQELLTLVFHQAHQIHRLLFLVLLVR